MVIDLAQVLAQPEPDYPKPQASTSSPGTASVPDAVSGTSVAASVPDAATEGGSAQGNPSAVSVPNAAEGVNKPKWPLTNCNTCNCTEDWRDMHAKKVWEEGPAGSFFTYVRTCIP